MLKLCESYKWGESLSTLHFMQCKLKRIRNAVPLEHSFCEVNANSFLTEVAQP